MSDDGHWSLHLILHTHLDMAMGVEERVEDTVCHTHPEERDKDGGPPPGRAPPLKEPDAQDAIDDKLGSHVS